jgi:acyl dehydratase
VGVALFRRGVAVGDELPSIARQFRLDDFKRGDEQTIHTDAEAARREGLAVPVAVGPQVASLVFRQLRACFGKGWIEGGSCTLTFRRPVMVTDFCVARGVVTHVAPAPAGALQVACDVWIENQDGERVIVGSASGAVDAD